MVVSFVRRNKAISAQLTEIRMVAGMNALKMALQPGTGAKTTGAHGTGESRTDVVVRSRVDGKFSAAPIAAATQRAAA